MSHLLRLNRIHFNNFRYLTTTTVLHSQDHYKVLGVNSKSTTKEIKKAFRKKSLNCHPDKFPGDKEKEDQFKELSEAYQTLSDKKLKSDYDLKHKTSGPVSQGYSPSKGGKPGNFNWEDGEFSFRRPEDRAKYTYSARGSGMAGRKFKDGKTAHQRSEGWSQMYEELNRQRHQNYQHAKQTKQTDFSDFMDGSRGDRNYKNFKHYYTEHPDNFKEKGEFSGFANDQEEGNKFGTRERGWQERLVERFDYEMNINALNKMRIMRWLDNGIRFTVLSLFCYVLGTTVYAVVSGGDKDNFTIRKLEEMNVNDDLQKSRRLYNENRYFSQSTTGNTNISAANSINNDVMNERVRIYNERLAAKEAMLERQQGSKS